MAALHFSVAISQSPLKNLIGTECMATSIPSPPSLLFSQPPMMSSLYFPHINRQCMSMNSLVNSSSEKAKNISFCLKCIIWSKTLGIKVQINHTDKNLTYIAWF